MNRAHALAAVVLAITTQNVRTGLPPAEVGHDVRQAAAHSTVVIGQEFGARHARHYAPRGWAVAHYSGLRRGDCATYWDRAVWRENRQWLVPVTHADFRAGHRFALVTVLSHGGMSVAVVCVHMITRWKSRRAVEAHGIARIRALAERLARRYGRVVVGGDWNRRWVDRAALPGFRAARPPRPTHRPGVRIDYVFRHGGRLRHIGVIGHTYSDHNGVREVIAWRG